MLWGRPLLRLQPTSLILAHAPLSLLLVNCSDMPFLRPTLERGSLPRATECVTRGDANWDDIAISASGLKSNSKMGRPATMSGRDLGTYVLFLEKTQGRTVRPPKFVLHRRMCNLAWTR